MSAENSNALLQKEVAIRRTFAIISHPDAGKTTLTEKLLLYAGMIRTAGMVHGRKTQKKVSSDWMALEQERGISITASAMQFAYKGVIINVLDTPGHQDFSEDTYRTLTAADSAVMVIDAAKGVEPQTLKLFKVCKLRGIPVLTFINKMDLPSRDPLELISEVEEALEIQAAPMNWPVGGGSSFRGVYDRTQDELVLFQRAAKGGSQLVHGERFKLEEATQKEILNEKETAQLKDEIELLNEAGNPFSREEFLEGTVSPVFFGSALTNFGIEAFFDSFAELAPCPSARSATTAKGEEISVDPTAPFSAYVFKVQANMDPRHRDSMAYLRICSGRFSRDQVVKHSRSKKEIRLSRSHSMFGQERTTVDHASPGDIVGVVNPGVFAIGDTVSLKGEFSFRPMPSFPPEVVARITPSDVMRKKAFDKGMEQFRAEGTVLILHRYNSQSSDCLIAAVGPLQFEVLQHRLTHEYRVKSHTEQLPYRFGAWLKGNPDTFELTSSSILACDHLNRVIVLYTTQWERNFLLEKNPKHELLDFV